MINKLILGVIKIIIFFATINKNHYYYYCTNIIFYNIKKIIK